MDERYRTYGGLALAVLLIVVGTFATGLLPSGALYQVLAGAIIVAGFAIGYYSLGVFDEFR
jgi:hypothetical protein